MVNNINELENVIEEIVASTDPAEELMDPTVEDQTTAEDPEVMEDPETVSDGDVTPSTEQYIISQDMLQQLIDANANLEIIIENQELESMTIWEKPLSDYTVLEGIGLITLATIIGVVIFKLVGGIITCSL